MAAKSGAIARQNPADAVSVEETRQPHPFLRLREIHDEAQEVSQLANLLGRSFQAVLLFPALVIALLLFVQPPVLRAASFTLLVLAGSGALFYAYVRALRAPFDLTVLRAFAADLDAVMLYAGFAWGAGAFLVLPVNAEPAIAVAFGGCSTALVAMVLRSREAVFMFAAPAGLLTALAAYLRPLSLPPLTAALTLLACGFVVGAVVLSHRMKERNAQAQVPFDPSPA